MKLWNKNVGESDRVYIEELYEHLREPIWVTVWTIYQRSHTSYETGHGILQCEEERYTHDFC